jgi:cytochrome c peroxidase
MTKVTYILVFVFGSLLALGVVLSHCRNGNRKILQVDVIGLSYDSQIIAQRISLGRILFYDVRLSKNNKVACSTCHIPEFAFTDRKPLSIGVNGRISLRNAPTLLNVSNLKKLMFDAEVPTLEQQVIVPIQEHNEMDMKMEELIFKLRKLPEYQKKARAFFSRDFDAYVLTRCLASFERTLISKNSRFDRFVAGEKNILTRNESAGYKLFSEKLHCINLSSLSRFYEL